MVATPRELLDTSIAQLQTLTAFLGEQLGGRADDRESSTTPEIRACQEILVSLGALILKVQAARRLRWSSEPSQGPWGNVDRFTSLERGPEVRPLLTRSPR